MRRFKHKHPESYTKTGNGLTDYCEHEFEESEGKRIYLLTCKKCSVGTTIDRVEEIPEQS